MRPLFSALVLLSTTLLCSCAAQPKLETSISGAMPSGATYAVSDASATAPELRALVVERLARRGVSEGSDGVGYLLEIAYAERPAVSGLIVPDQSPQAWLSAPEARRPRGLVRSLVVSLTETKSGKEVYRAAAIERGPGEAKGEAAARLAAAALSDPTTTTSAHP